MAGKYKHIIHGWLKSGFVEYNSTNINPIDEGIPQGGIISPLLMNLTLNGIENIIMQSMIEYTAKTKNSRIRSKKGGESHLVVKRAFDGEFKEHSITPKFFRYADDFIIICGSQRLLNTIKEKISYFLNLRGLEIHPNKTRIIKFGINTPFTFLSYTFVVLRRTNHIRNKALHRSSYEFKLKGRARLYVMPNVTKVKDFRHKIKLIIKKSYNSTAYNLIANLNPKIRGWVNYFSYSNSHGVLSSLRAWLYKRLNI